MPSSRISNRHSSHEYPSSTVAQTGRKYSIERDKDNGSALVNDLFHDAFFGTRRFRSKVASSRRRSLDEESIATMRQDAQDHEEAEEEEEEEVPEGPVRQTYARERVFDWGDHWGRPRQHEPDTEPRPRSRPERQRSEQLDDGADTERRAQWIYRTLPQAVEDDVTRLRAEVEDLGGTIPEVNRGTVRHASEVMESARVLLVDKEHEAWDMAFVAQVLIRELELNSRQLMELVGPEWMRYRRTERDIDWRGEGREDRRLVERLEVQGQRVDRVREVMERIRGQWQDERRR